MELKEKNFSIERRQRKEQGREEVSQDATTALIHQEHGANYLGCLYAALYRAGQMNVGHNHSFGARCVKLLLKITLSSITEVRTSKSYRAERPAYHPAASRVWWSRTPKFQHRWFVAYHIFSRMTKFIV